MTVSKPIVFMCPSCNSQQLGYIYRQQGIPTNSCLLSDSRDRASHWTRADLDLALCRACGFIFNASFKPDLVRYDARYEDQQRHSPTFGKFAVELATKLVDKYALKGKRVLEIGCGKADFLHLICEMGGNTGYGVDPAVNPGRLDPAIGDRVTLYAEAFAPEHASLNPEWICCRHTLEHISETRQFLELLRQCIGDRHDVGVFFEVPDATRILKQGAFEDIYYEHCSYFTAGALGRLFRACGFAIVDLYRGYGDQYLMIEALPCSTTQQQPHTSEEPVCDIIAAAERFEAEVIAKLNLWQERIARAAFGEAAIWGSGSKCVAFLEALGSAERFPWVVDINPHRHGLFLPGTGKQVLSPKSLRSLQPDSVVVMNALYEEEIENQLREMAVTASVSSL